MLYRNGLYSKIIASLINNITVKEMTSHHIALLLTLSLLTAKKWNCVVCPGVGDVDARACDKKEKRKRGKK